MGFSNYVNLNIASCFHVTQAGAREALSISENKPTPACPGEMKGEGDLLLISGGSSNVQNTSGVLNNNYYHFYLKICIYY